MTPTITTVSQHQIRGRRHTAGCCRAIGALPPCSQTYHDDVCQPSRESPPPRERQHEVHASRFPWLHHP